MEGDKYSNGTDRLSEKFMCFIDTSALVVDGWLQFPYEYGFHDRNINIVMIEFIEDYFCVIE